MAEKLLSEMPRPLRDLYDKGKAALDRQNWDYAIAFFSQILEKDPTFYECREALRAAQFRKGTGTSFRRKVFDTASNFPKLAKGQLALRNDPWEAIRIAEQVLSSDPNHTGGHKLLADAALQVDMPKTAVLSLEIAFKNAPQDKDIAFRLGKALSLTGNPARAEEIFTELARLNPYHPEISQALKNFSAARTMTEGGYATIASGEGSYRDILKDQKGSVTLEQENRAIRNEDVAANLIREYESRLQLEPLNLKLMRSIAELYTGQQDFDRALSFYDRIMNAEGGTDPSLEKAIAETIVKKYDYALAQWDPTDPQYSEARAKLEAERDAHRLNDCKRRADKYPNDLHLRFELGELYFQAGKIKEAIQEFQRAQANPNRRIASLNYLGQCFSRRGMHDMAARAFQTAVKEKLVFDDEKKELLYHLGSTLQQMGKPDEAIEQFKQIYETDIGFKDVAAKVDAYYADR